MALPFDQVAAHALQADLKAYDFLAGIFSGIGIVIGHGLDTMACSDFMKYFCDGRNQGHHPRGRFEDYNGLARIIHKLERKSIG